ncbi:MAG: replicative DNA helicase [Magnetococcales bacterium]|nr:replicative DNA helicase [Magnetococcales bacterium]
MPPGVESYPASEPEVESLRQVPWSMAAEQSVLGSVLLDNGVLEQIADLLTPDDFYVGAHQTIYRVMLDLFERNEVSDPVILTEVLDRNAELESVGGAVYISRLAMTVPTAANARSYARLVHDKAVLRDMAREATTIVENVHKTRGLKVDEVIDDAESRIFSVAERKDQRRSSYHSLNQVIMPVFERLENLMDRGDDVTGVPTGFTDLDAKLAGLQPSDLLILAGRPAMGKTALAMNIAANAAIDHEMPVAVFSLEMSKEQLATRLLASQGRIDAQGLRTGRLSEEDYHKLTQAASELGKTPIYIDDTPALTITALRAKARRLKRERNIRLIVVDYLQLMRAPNAGENRVQEISMISQGLKAIAKEMNVPVIALSQLSRSVEGRTDKRPILSDLRESGSIEQDADVVMFVFREEYYKQEDTSLHGKAELIVSKQRNGPTGTVNLTFLHQYTRFENFTSIADYAR